MWILIMIVSLKGQFHHDIDVKSAQGFRSIVQCQAVGERVTASLKKTDPDLRIEFFCEQGY